MRQMVLMPKGVDRLAQEESAMGYESAFRRAAFMLVTIAILALSFAAYHFAIVRPAFPHFAVVDVAELYRVKEAEFSKIIGDPRATDADRVKAMQNAQRFAQDLQTLIDTLPKECGCVVLNKAAVMSGGGGFGLTDLTPQARKAVGL
jgi:hypothetical protein